MCNRLWSLLPSLALAMERKETLHILFQNQNDLAEFPELKTCKYLKFLTQKDNRVIASILYRLLAVLNPKEDLSKYGRSRKQFMVINSWKHTCDESFIQKYKSQLIELLSFRKSVENKVNNCLPNFDGFTIGVHIRKGDYKEWRNGRYYYDDNRYIKWIIDLQEQIYKKGYNCRFCICSNEPFFINDPSIDIVRIPDATGIEDLCALSKCDFIMGPPSSFSQWASFLGNVPLLFLLDKNQTICIDDFSPVTSMNKFANQKKMIDNNGITFSIE